MASGQASYRGGLPRRLSREPQPLRKLLVQYLQEAGLADIEAAYRVGDAWRHAVPERFRVHTRVRRLRAGVLEVAVGSSAVLYELEGFYRHDLLARLRETAAVCVAEIKFRLESMPGENGNR